MADRGHVNTNLMGTPGFKLKRQQGVSIFCAYFLIMGDGSFTMFIINLAFDGGGAFSSDWGVNGAEIIGFTLHNCQIFALYIFDGDFLT